MFSIMCADGLCLLCVLLMLGQEQVFWSGHSGASWGTQALDTRAPLLRTSLNRRSTHPSFPSSTPGSEQTLDNGVKNGAEHLSVPPEVNERPSSLTQITPPVNRNGGALAGNFPSRHLMETDEDYPVPPRPTPPHFPEMTSPFTAVSAQDDQLFFLQAARAYHDYCEQSCSDGSGSSPSMHICRRCFCDSVCFMFGDCCPDLYVSHVPTPVSDKLTCSPASFGSPPIVEYVMWTQCDDVTNSSLKLMCESNDTSDWKKTQPVTSTDSFYTYKNIHCAQCNSDATNLMPWNLFLNVKDPTTIQEATSSYELYQIVLENKDNHLDYESPQSMESHIRQCEPVISVCNLTGLWNGYDVSVVRACSLFDAPVKHDNGDVYYKNPFCYLCNTYYSWTEMLNMGEPPTLEEDGVPLMTLLNFKDDDDVDSDQFAREGAASTCSKDMFFDPKTKSCRDVHCAPGKQPTSSSILTCTSSPAVSNIYGYQLCVYTDITGQDTDMDHLMEVMDEASLTDESFHHEDRFAYVAALITSLSLEGHSVDMKRLLINIRFFSPVPVFRDSLDGLMLNLSSHLMSVLQADLGMNGLEESPTCSPEVFQSLMKNGTKSDEHWGTLEFIPRSAPAAYVAAAEKVTYLQLSAPLVCPAVELEPWEFELDQNSHQLLVLQDNSTVIGNVDVPFFQITESDTGLVCIDQYLHLFPDDKHKAKHERDVVLSWVSIVALIISLVFLLVSLVIYCLLSSLRTIAGINNLLLIIVLFGGQLYLLVGPELSGVVWLCEVVGVTGHYLWLAVVMAQSACTFHMFYTLSFPLLSHAAMASPAAMTRRYVSYVLLTSALFVVVTLAWQGAAEGDSGYGGSRCYITKALARIVMFGLPLAGSVLVNVVMFLFTVWRLRHLQQVTSTRSNRKSLLLYLKLSVFTGVTWLLGFLASGLGSVVLEYLFVVLQGCQGLFIFLAFLANGRVMQMLRDRARGVETNRTISSRKTARTDDFAHTKL